LCGEAPREGGRGDEKSRKGKKLGIRKPRDSRRLGLGGKKTQKDLDKTLFACHETWRFEKGKDSEMEGEGERKRGGSAAIRARLKSKP